MDNSLDSYFSDIGGYELLSLKEERRLCENLIKKGKLAQEAKDKLILSNLRLVIKIATKYQGRGLDLEDLITEGNIGLAKSVNRFDPKFKNKFCTYASYWIKHHITRAIEIKGREVRLPTHAITASTQIFKYREEYKRKRGEYPTVDQICSKVKVTKKTAINILNSTGGRVELDCPAGEDGRSTIGELMNDDSMITPDKIVTFLDDSKMLKECMGELNLKERKVLTYRFGLDDGEGQTLEKIGEMLGLTRERIRQIQHEALQKMKVKIKKKEKF